MKILDVPQSGSLGGNTSSHNRYGQYRRERRVPVNVRSAAQEAVRAHMAAAAAAWRGITDAQRAGWTDLGGSMTATDSLGQTHTFNGFEAFTSVNLFRLQYGDTLLSDAPALTTPVALTSITPAAAAGAATHTLAYTATPLSAGVKAVIEASPQVSAGRKFNNKFAVLLTTAAAAASPANIAAAYTAKYGALVAGNRIFYRVRLYTAGFTSGPIVASTVVAA